VHETAHDPEVGLVFVGFSPPDRLAALARHLGWPGAVLSDQPRRLYAALGLGRASLWRVYSRRTLAMYARAVLRRERLRPPVEDTRQLGADALVVDGVVVRLWRPRSPDDRPEAGEVLAAASAALDRWGD
jgi:hypothetical protein